MMVNEQVHRVMVQSRLVHLCPAQK